MTDLPQNERVASDPAAPRPWGVLAQFDGAAELLAAVKTVRADGYSSLEAFAPFPVPELGKLIAPKRSPMPLIIFIGGVLGGAGIYALMVWINLYAYRINVGGRPLNSWPAFIPPTFECIVLLSSLFAIIGVIVVCGLPRLHHPLFEIEAFRRASTDGFFLAVKSDDARFDRQELRARLKEIGGIETWEVPHE